MTTSSRTTVRFLKVYVFGVTSLVLGLALTAFQGKDSSGKDSSQKQHFGEIDVERMNIVEKDGTVKLIVSDKARFPGLYIKGKEHPYPRGVAGIVFLDDEGSEYGTLATHTWREPTGFGAFSGLRFGQFGGGQTVGMVYDDDNGQRQAGLVVREQPTIPVSQLFERGDSVQNMPDGLAKSRAMAELSRATGAERILVGRTHDQSATVALSDASGKPRVRLVVDSAGAARLDFLDANGQVTRSISGATAQ